jgi:hypothetical protein
VYIFLTVLLLLRFRHLLGEHNIDKDSYFLRWDISQAYKLSCNFACTINCNNFHNFVTLVKVMLKAKRKWQVPKDVLIPYVSKYVKYLL